MIKVAFTRDDNARTVKLTVKGHAGQASLGCDIVCAAASILAFTVAQIVKTMEHHGDLTEVCVMLDNGDAEISCTCPDNELFAEAAHSFFVAHVGYTLLARQYPQYVQLVEPSEA